MKEREKYTLLRLSEVLREKGVTGKDLASKVGVSETTISQHVGGTQYPRPELLLKIAKALDVDVRDLFHSTKKKEADEILRQIINDLQVVYSNIKK